VDPAGHRLASAEGPLIASHEESALPSPGDIVHTYHLVTVPVTQPPGPVSLETRVYEADTLAPFLPADGTVRGSVRLAEATVGLPLTPVSPEELRQPERPLRADMGSGLTLLGLDGWSETVPSGDLLSLRLYWLAEGADLSSWRLQPLTLSLVGTQVSTTVSLPGGVPPSGEQVFHTFADLRLPADLPAGSYALALAATPGATPVKLGDVSIVRRDRQFEPPALAYPLTATFGDVVDASSPSGAPITKDSRRRIVAALGLATSPLALEAAPGQPITVTLVWRALETPTGGLMRFVHVLGPDGHPAAQRDSIPCDGTCSATSWLPGEVLLDPVEIEIPSTLPPGSYPLAAGWYDLATRTRLPVYDAAGQRLAEDLLVLPVSVNVIPRS
jgi:hypothetical protein